MKRLTVCALAALLLCTSSVHAQHALVLSGGGARGLSHAGALAALEELGYRPDFVVGASMGAIIGALYAAGYEAADIRRIIGRENWLERFAAEPLLVGPERAPRRALLGFGISRGRFYGGFLPETGINQRLIELLFDAGVRARNDFDALPVRYRAVTTDLADGSEIVIGAGDLPRAVRASMAVPGVFAPVRWNDRVLVDGGVANNVPVSVARAHSTAPVIAIDVLRPTADIVERGALDIGVRALRLLIENARPDSGSVPDILVLPRLEPGLSETYFPADATNLINTGYRAVRAQVPPITPEPDARRPAGSAPPRIDRLVIENANDATARLVRRMMVGAVRGYDADDIVNRVAALHMTGLFQSVWPRVEQTAGDAVLIVDVTRVASTSVSGGAAWDNDQGAGAWLLLRQLVDLRTPVELKLTGTFDQLGHGGSVDASFFSSLVPGLTWNGGAHAIEERLRFFEREELLRRDWSRRAGAWLGAELHGSIGRWYLSALARADHLREPSRDGWAIGPFIRLARTPAPDREVGLDPAAELEARGGDFEYQRAALRAGPAFRFEQIRIAPMVSVESVSGGAPSHALAASTRELAPWLPDGALRARHLAAAGVDAAVPILMSGYARVRLRAVGTGSDLDAVTSSAAWTAGAELGAIWPTVLGPISLGFALGDNGERRFNIGLGARF